MNESFKNIGLLLAVLVSFITVGTVVYNAGQTNAQIKSNKHEIEEIKTMLTKMIEQEAARLDEEDNGVRSDHETADQNIIMFQDHLYHQHIKPLEQKLETWKNEQKTH